MAPVTKQQQKSPIWQPHIDLALFAAIDRMSFATLPEGCTFAAISSLHQHVHNRQPALVAPALLPTGGQRPARFDRPPSWLGA
jgi:hypothetical protein